MPERVFCWFLRRATVLELLSVPKLKTWGVGPCFLEWNLGTRWRGGARRQVLVNETAKKKLALTQTSFKEGGREGGREEYR